MSLNKVTLVISDHVNMAQSEIFGESSFRGSAVGTTEEYDLFKASPYGGTPFSQGPNWYSLEVSNSFNNVVTTVETLSKGQEFELSGQPIPNSNITANFTRAVATHENIDAVTQVFGSKTVAMLAFPLVGFWASIMWGIIFSLALNSLDQHHGTFAGILCTGIIGGAIVPLFIGKLGDLFGFGIGKYVLLSTLAYHLHRLLGEASCKQCDDRRPEGQFLFFGLQEIRRTDTSFATVSWEKVFNLS